MCVCARVCVCKYACVLIPPVAQPDPSFQSSILQQGSCVTLTHPSHLTWLTFPPGAVRQANRWAISQQGHWKVCLVPSLFTSRAFPDFSITGSGTPVQSTVVSHMVSTCQEGQPHCQLPSLVLAKRTDRPVLACVHVCVEEAEVGE